MSSSCQFFYYQFVHRLEQKKCPSKIFLTWMILLSILHNNWDKKKKEKLFFLGEHEATSGKCKEMITCHYILLTMCSITVGLFVQQWYRLLQFSKKNNNRRRKLRGEKKSQEMAIFVVMLWIYILHHVGSVLSDRCVVHIYMTFGFRLPIAHTHKYNNRGWKIFLYEGRKNCRDFFLYQHHHRV